jgi:ribosome-interacting GTPase 1
MDKEKCINSILNENLLGISSAIIDNTMCLNSAIDVLYSKYLNNLKSKVFYYKDLNLIIRFESVISLSEFTHKLVIDKTDYSTVIATVSVKHDCVENSIFDVTFKNISFKEFIQIFYKLEEANESQIDKITKCYECIKASTDKLYNTLAYDMTEYINACTKIIKKNNTK